MSIYSGICKEGKDRFQMVLEALIGIFELVMLLRMQIGRLNWKTRTIRTHNGKHI